MPPQAWPTVLDEAADTAADTADAVADTAADAAGDAMSITDLLSPDTFDADKLVTMIDESALGDTQKAALKTAIETAGDNPEAVEGVIDQIKQAMGLKPSPTPAPVRAGVRCT